MPSTCELCEREVPATTCHHLFPKSQARRKGRAIAELPTADLCPACHKQIHRLFDNRRLATQLTTVEAIRGEPEMARFLLWLRKQPGSKRIRVR